MIARLGLAALVLALGVAAFLLWRPGAGREEGAPRREASEAQAVRESPALVSPSIPAAAESLTARQEIAPAPPAAEPETPARSGGSGGGLLSVRGVLVHSSDHRPAAGATLILHFGDQYTRVVTDAAGRFESEPVVPAGGVRAWHMADPSRPDYVVHLEVEPESFLVASGPLGEPLDIELVLVDPPAWLAVEVFGPSGAPAPAKVSWSLHPREISAETPARAGGELTDSHGRARLPYPSVDPGTRFALLARGEGELVSQLVIVEAPPPAEPVRLELDQGGRIRARVLDALGGPLEGQEVRLWSEDPQVIALSATATTDAAGSALFTAVSPGRFDVMLWRKSSSEWLRQSVEVERGVTAEVELVVPVHPLAAAGKVLDEEGNPLGSVEVSLFRNDGESGRMLTDEAGRFAFRAPAGGPVRLSTETDIWGDRYQPAALDVPFGTDDVLFRRVESKPSTHVVLEIVQGRTLARVPGVMVIAFREPLCGDWSYAHGPEGVVELDLKLYGDVGITVEAVGYRRRRLGVPELVRSGPEDGRYRIELEPGLERALRILDSEDEEPLVGALVYAGELLVSTADGEGRAALDLPSWPVELRIAATGHEDASWACADWLSELEDGYVWLDRASQGD